VEVLDYDFDLSKLERVISGAGKVAALGHELERRGLKRTIVVDWEDFGRPKPANADQLLSCPGTPRDFS
jgi:hypothetical protein